MYRALATANEFVQAGWEVTVLTADRDTFAQLTDVDPLTEQAIDERVRVRRVAFDLSRGETDLARWPRWRMESPLAWSGAKLLGESIGFPEPRYGGWRRNLLPAARAIHADQPVDLVIGTANPNVDFTPGWDLYRKFGIPYVMDYRDTWHLDMYTGHRTSPPWSRSGRWERRLLTNAAEVWFVNEPIRHWHENSYPTIAGKSHVVSNGFDEGFLEGLGARSRSEDDPLSIGYLGTIYGPMPLEQTFEGWRIARQQSDLLSRSTLDIYGRLGHYATPDLQVKEMLDRYRSAGVRYHGKVSKTDVARTYSRFDGLALILGRSPFITSGKVFEYVATGLPIAALHHPDTASTAVLDGYPLAVASADDTAESFARSFVELAGLIQRTTEEDRMRARSAAQRWERRQQLAPRIDALSELVASPR